MTEELKIAARKTLLALLSGSVPERREEIATIFDDHVSGVEVLPDTTSSQISTHGRTIRFSFKDLDRCWIIGFSCASALPCYGAQLQVAYKTGQVIDDVIDGDAELYAREGDFKDALHTAQQFLAASDMSLVPWPPSIPRPLPDRTSLKDSFEMVIYDLTLMGTAFVMLHEVRHAIIRSSNIQFPALRDEENDCDVWAKSFLIEKYDSFARLYGHDHSLSLSKRAMGLAVGALIIHEFTPREQRSGGPLYFSVGDRLRTLLGDLDLSDDDNFWPWAAALLVGIYRRDQRKLPYAGLTPKNLTKALLNDL